MSRRNSVKTFQNGKDTGSYTNIRFEIIGQTELGKESIFFDTDIHYLDIGQGETVLLVHGIGQSLFTWRNNIDFLVKNGYRVIALDMAGFGYSGQPNIYYTAEEYALVIEAFLGSLRIRHTHIVGFSTGCLSAICFAAANPRRVGKMVLISPGAPNAKYPFAMKFLATRLGRTVSRLHFSETVLRKVLHDMYFDTTLITEDVVEGYYAPYRNKHVRETLSISMTHFDDENPRSLLRGIKNETLIFYGTDDKLHNEQTVNSYAAAIPDSSLIKIRNCSHLLHEEKPVKFNDEMLRFLKKGETIEQIPFNSSYRQELVD